MMQWHKIKCTERFENGKKIYSRIVAYSFLAMFIRSSIRLLFFSRNIKFLFAVCCRCRCRFRGQLHGIHHMMVMIVFRPNTWVILCICAHHI